MGHGAVAAGSEEIPLASTRSITGAPMLPEPRPSDNPPDFQLPVGQDAGAGKKALTSSTHIFAAGSMI